MNRLSDVGQRHSNRSSEGVWRSWGMKAREALECYKQNLMKYFSGSSEEQDANRNMDSKGCVMGSLLEMKAPGTWTRDLLGSCSNLTYLHLIRALRFWGRLNLKMAN